MSDIFREVDEEVRADRIKTLWQTWGSYIIGFAIAIVLAVAFRVFWADYKDDIQQAESARFDAAVAFVEAGDNDAAIISLESMISETDSGYATIAEFKVAASHIEKGDLNSAIKIYENLAAESSLSDRFRGLASYLAAANLMDTANTKDLIARLEPLAIQGEDWFFSSTELLGILALKEGDLDGATSYFSSIILDPTAPQSLRQRAQEVLDVIDSVKPEENLFEDFENEKPKAEEEPSEEGN